MQRQTQFSKLLMVTVSAMALVMALDLSAVQAQEVHNLSEIVVSSEQETDNQALESDEVIGEEELNVLNAQTVQDLFAATPAIVVAGGTSAAQKFYLHGIDQAKVNIVIDGARQRSGIWHHTSGDIGIEPAFLKQVDVKSGVSPADAGPGALAGTIAFETKDAKDLLLPGQTMGGLISAGYKSNSSTYQVTGSAYGMHDGLELVGIVKHAQGGNYKDGGGHEELGTDPDVWNGLGKLAYESDGGHRFSLSAERFSDTGLRRLRADMNLNGPVNYNEHTNTRTTVTAKYVNTQGGGMFDPEILLYMNRNEIERPFGNYARYSGDFNSDMVEFGGKAVNKFHFALGTITAGVDFYNNHIDLERFYSNDTLDETITNVGGQVQARFKPMDRLEISTGTRVDFQRYEAVDGQNFETVGFSPNFSASFEILDGLKFNAGAASVFGGLEPSEMALYASASPYKYASNLKPTRSNNFEAGLSYQKDGWKASAKIFHTRMTNPIAYDYTNWPASGARVNGADLVSSGFDVSARYDWSNAYISAAFTHTDVKYDGKASGLVYNTSLTVGDMLTLQGAYTFTDLDLTLGAKSQIAFDIDEPSLGTPDDLKGYQVIDLFAEYKPEKVLEGFTLRADVTNLLDQKYVARGTRLNGSRWEPVHSPGRSFNITATKKF